MVEKSRRQEILAISARLFRERGYNATSIRDIATAVGMESASLYNHMENKHELLKVLLLDLADNYVAGIDRICASSLTSIEKLEAVVKEHIRITINNSNEVSLIPSEYVHLEEVPKQEYIAKRNHYESQFIALFEQCVSDNYIKNVNTNIAVYSILSTLRWLYSWREKHSEIEQSKLEEELLSNLLGGITNH